MLYSKKLCKLNVGNKVYDYDTCSVVIFITFLTKLSGSKYRPKRHWMFKSILDSIVNRIGGCVTKLRLPGCHLLKFISI